MVEGELNVDGEKTKEKSCPILATGGTCELMGKEMSGAACENGNMRARTAQVARCEVIFIVGGLTHSLCQDRKQSDQEVEDALSRFDFQKAGRQKTLN